MKRNNSAIELTRIIFLFLLIAAHWSHYWQPVAWSNLDTKVIQGISVVSVSGFAMITGIYAFRPRSLVFRNISRLLFIIVISIIIGFTVFACINVSWKNNYTQIFTGSRDSWYLYGILGVYFVAPFLRNFLEGTKKYTPILLGMLLVAGVQIARIFTQTQALFQNGAESFLFLLGMTFIGYAIPRFKTCKFNLNRFFISILVFTMCLIVIIANYCGGEVFTHELPTTTLLAFSLVGLCFYNPFYSKQINWIAKKLYFVYEFHWYWQILWISLFGSFIKQNPHLQLYVNWIVIFLFGSVMSMIITELQLKVWNKYVDPQMLKAISWTKSKLIKPKVSN